MASFGFGGGQGGTERRTGTLFGSTAAPAGGLFGQSQQQNTTTQSSQGLFSSSTSQQQPAGGMFGSSQPQNTGSTLFGASQQPQQPQLQQQQQALNNSIFGGKLQPAPTLPALQAQQLNQSQTMLPQLRQTGSMAFASTAVNGQREKSVVDQFDLILSKWRPGNPNCEFQYYFYNQVKPDEAPFYGPQPHEDERKWDEALQKKPNPGSIPVLAYGFEQLAARINYQRLCVTGLRTRLHEINNSLALMKDEHELRVSSRIAEAKRKHVVFMQRTLALATKIQILRNRGYVMDQGEEELKKKLVDLEKKTFDPVLAGRQEEIWARMSGVRERARILQEETEKLGNAIDSQKSGQLLSDEDQKQLDKLLKDYDKQLDHLKKWVDDTKQEYDEWETLHKPSHTGR